MRNCVRIRSRLFLFALAAIAALTLRSSDAVNGERLLALLLDKLLGGNVDIDRAALSVLLWSAALFVSARYFQATVHLERQYAHLARVENEVAALFGSDLLSRESTGYLKDYPLFSNWMHVLYTWVFPLALLVVAIWSIVIEVRLSGLGLSTLTAAVVGVGVIASAALYLYSTKVESRRRRDPEE